ncbi:MAG TPA: hypothetical protein VE934_04365 [Polaromonas sp.]|uniref:hypothetical protein n=1 Tax=Polaromonas sp. TaxID=1869339 RepID=UPI002D4E959E|nr:hypothetical protein [Polaromonas sp.]HYW56168.1 hypothetical protein [Polaromonas sp.]
MKILLRLTLCDPALARALAADPELAKVLGARPNAAVAYVFPKYFDASGPILSRVLRYARDHGQSLSLLRDMQFTSAELNAASHLEVVCRTTIAQTRPDADATRAAWKADTLHPTSSEWAVRLPSQLYLTEVVPTTTIAIVDQWTGEYALGADATQSVRASGLSGWKLTPVLHPRHGALPDASQHLTTSELLPAALMDLTRIATYDDGPRQPSQPRRYGLLSYMAASLANTADFTRTAEPWGPWRTPQWVVRQRVRQWFLGSGLRGWAFWPILEEGTALHAEHVARWTETLAQLRAADACVSI